MVLRMITWFIFSILKVKRLEKECERNWGHRFLFKSLHIFLGNTPCHFERSRVVCHSERSRVVCHSERSRVVCHSERSRGKAIPPRFQFRARNEPRNLIHHLDAFGFLYYHNTLLAFRLYPLIAF